MKHLLSFTLSVLFTAAVMGQQNPRFSVQKLNGNSGVLGDRDSYSQILFGPDGHLYATRTIPGQIWRFLVDDEGDIVDEELLLDEEVAGSGINGIVFDLAASASNLVFYYSRVHLGGRVYRVKVDEWGTANPLLDHVLLIDNIGIMGNHAINNMTYGPDDLLYITLSGQDHTGWLGEVPWSATVVSADLSHSAFDNLPIDISSPDVLGDTEYTGDEPIKIYVTGVRNGQGLHYHTNGYLYGTIHDPPASGPIPHPELDDFTANLDPLPDFVARYEKGKHYGHTNPSRGELVYYGGNPTAGKDIFEVTDLPVGTMPSPRMDMNLIQGTDENMCIAGLGEYSNGNLLVSYMKERGRSVGYVEWFNLDEDGYFTNPDPERTTGNHDYIQDLEGNVIEFGGVLDVEVVRDKGWVYVADWGLRAGDRGDGEIAGLYLLKPDVAPVMTDKPARKVLNDPPAWNKGGISLILNKASHVNIQMVNISGQNINKTQVAFTGSLPQGHHVIQIVASQPGVNLITVDVGGKIYNLKAISLK